MRKGTLAAHTHSNGACEGVAARGGERKEGGEAGAGKGRLARRARAPGLRTGLARRAEDKRQNADGGTKCRRSMKKK